jgi:hypothetical protein
MPKLPNVLRWASTYMTGEEIWGKRVSPEEVSDALAALSVYDLLRIVGSLSVSLRVEPGSTSQETQAKLAGFAASDDPDLVQRLQAGLNRGQILIFAQQLYHLARLAILEADRRPADGLRKGTLVAKFHRALFGVSDQMDSDIGGDDDVISLELSLTAINHEEERLGQWALYYELFDRIWPTVKGAPDADQAFRRYTGLSIAEYLALGFAVSAGFGREVGGRPAAWIGIESWLSAVPITQAKREAFLAVIASTVDELRDALREEEEFHGRSTVEALAIEKKPIVRTENELYVVNFAAYERRATHGIFHILSEGPEEEGLSRETFTAPFGEAFQVWAEACVRRTEEGRAGVEIFADVPYGSKRERRDTPDVVLTYERNIVAMEMVAGAMRIQTLTHGNLETFALDLEKFIYKKAKQLSERIADVRNGLTEEIGLNAKGVSTIWPVIVTSVPFPVRPMIMESIRKELKVRGFLQGKGTGTISIIGGEELAALEGYVAASGETTLDVIRGWKSSAATGDLYLKNYLYERLGRPIPRTPHFKKMFDELSAQSHGLLFGSDGARAPR